MTTLLAPLPCTSRFRVGSDRFPLHLFESAKSLERSPLCIRFHKLKGLKTSRVAQMRSNHSGAFQREETKSAFSCLRGSECVRTPNV
jgi:hypothetical protein